MMSVNNRLKDIHISISTQTLTAVNDVGGKLVFPVSTARNGIGFEHGSYKTPVGRFRIAAKIGGEYPLWTVFKSRQPVGVWPHELPPSISKDDDLVLSRILWLEGLDEANKSTYDRYIYIHGTNHEDLLGTPASCGCIRMSNNDIALLYDMVDVGTPVMISES